MAKWGRPDISGFLVSYSSCLILHLADLTLFVLTSFGSLDHPRLTGQRNVSSTPVCASHFATSLSTPHTCDLLPMILSISKEFPSRHLDIVVILWMPYNPRIASHQMPPSCSLFQIWSFKLSDVHLMGRRSAFCGKPRGKLAWGYLPPSGKQLQDRHTHLMAVLGRRYCCPAQHASGMLNFRWSRLLFCFKPPGDTAKWW